MAVTRSRCSTVRRIRPAISSIPVGDQSVMAVLFRPTPMNEARTGSTAANSSTNRSDSSVMVFMPSTFDRVQCSPEVRRHAIRSPSDPMSRTLSRLAAEPRTCVYYLHLFCTSAPAVAHGPGGVASPEPSTPDVVSRSLDFDLRSARASSTGCELVNDGWVVIRDVRRRQLRRTRTERGRICRTTSQNWRRHD